MQIALGLGRGSQQTLAERQLEEIKSQGRGLVGWAHLLAGIMVIATSIASLITLASVVINRITEALTHHKSGQFVDIANVVISALFVIVMDTAAVYAATQIRIIIERNLSKGALWLHVPLVIVVSSIEGLTYGVMLWTYEPPKDWLDGLLIIARAIAVPLLSLYLVLARVVAPGASDIITLSNLASGLGLLNDVYGHTNDTSMSMARKAQIFSATSGNGTAEAKLQALMEVLNTPEGARPGTNPAELVMWSDLHAQLEEFGGQHGEEIDAVQVRVIEETQRMIAEQSSQHAATFDELRVAIEEAQRLIIAQGGQHAATIAQLSETYGSAIDARDGQIAEMHTALDDLRTTITERQDTVRAELEATISEQIAAIREALATQGVKAIGSSHNRNRRAAMRLPSSDIRDGDEAEALARQHWTPGMGVKRLVQLTGLSQTAAAKYIKVFKAEEQARAVRTAEPTEATLFDAQGALGTV